MPRLTTLFDSKDCYTDHAIDLDAEVQRLVEPLFVKYGSIGFSFREIAYVLHGAVLEVELNKLIEEKGEK